MPLPNSTLVQRVAVAHSAQRATPGKQVLWEPAPLLVDDRSGRLMVQTDGFLRPTHDYKEFTHDEDGDLTGIEYHLGGPTGPVVGVETITYDEDGNIKSQGIVFPSPE